MSDLKIWLHFNNSLMPVHDAIQNVRAALLQNDLAKALDDLNNVDVVILKVVQAFPPGNNRELLYHLVINVIEVNTTWAT